MSNNALLTFLFIAVLSYNLFFLCLSLYRLAVVIYRGNQKIIHRLFFCCKIPQAEKNILTTDLTANSPKKNMVINFEAEVSLKQV